MKKRGTFLAAGICALALLTGCGGEKTASDYVTLGEYKGIEIEAIADVTDEQVETEMVSRFRDKVEEGDTVNIDYVGKKDGEAFAGGTAQGQSLTIGSDSFIDGFEDGLIGVSVGDTVDLNLTFPDPYQNNPDLAGAAVVFTVTVNSIDGIVGAEMTDEVITANTAYATVDEYRIAVKEEMQGNIDGQKQSAIWEKVRANATIKSYPEDEVEAYVNDVMNYYQSMASYYGIDFATLLSANGLTEEQFKADCEESAREEVAKYMVLEAIAEKEGLTVSEEEVEEQIAEGMELLNAERDAAIEYYGGEDVIREYLLYYKVLEMLLNECVEV